MVSHSAYTAPEPVIEQAYRLEPWTEIARSLRAYSHSRKRCGKSFSPHAIILTYRSLHVSFAMNSSPATPNMAIPCPRFSYAAVLLATEYYA